MRKLNPKKILLFLILSLSIFTSYYALRNLTFNHQSNYKIRGVDISNQYSAGLDWNKLNGFNDFIILRAVRAVKEKKIKGKQSYISLIDKNFNKNWLDLENKKIIKGAYHFFAPGISAENQFNVFKEAVKLKKGDLPPILDVENQECDMNEALKWLKMAREYYKVQPILYTDYIFMKAFLNYRDLDCKLWIYVNESVKLPNTKIKVPLFFKNAQPDFEMPKCIFWQIKQDTSLNGFNEKVDLNVFLGDSISFKKILVQ
jgi:lysozyme